MSNFPLYDSLMKDIPGKNLTMKQHQEFIAKVLEIDVHGKELVYVLIQCYSNANGGFGSTTPYGGKLERCGRNSMSVTWDLSLFPQDLRHILHKFVLMHTEEMQEEMIRSETLPGP